MASPPPLPPPPFPAPCVPPPDRAAVGQRERVEREVGSRVAVLEAVLSLPSPPRPLPYRCGGKLGWGLHGGGMEGVGWRDPSLVRCVPAGAGQCVMWLGGSYVQWIWCVGITGLARLASQI